MPEGGEEGRRFINLYAHVILQLMIYNILRFHGFERKAVDESAVVVRRQVDEKG